MAVKNFEELEIWKEARRLTQIIYQLTKTDKFSKDFSLRDQIRRATVSIMLNIAEGFERVAIKNFSNFSTSRNHPAVKCAHSFTSDSIKNTS